jgi:opacity protein-like surface antigen
MTRPAFVLALLILVPASSHAQVAVRVFGDAGVTVFTATQSFKAILGKPSGGVFGGGIEIDKQQWFVTLAARRFHRSGHRVFVFNNEVFPLNVEDTITVTPLDLTAGYRFRWHGLVPYAGGGIGWHRFEETSEHATDQENVKKTYTGYHVAGGVEKPLRRWLAAAADAEWATVPNALGDSTTGVAKVYDEHNLGGLTLRARVVVGL